MGQAKWRKLTSGLATTTGIKFDTDGSAIIRTVGESEPVLDHNQRLRALATDDGGYVRGSDRGMKRVASIPAEIVVKWAVEEGIDVYNPEHSERVMRKLNDPDYAYLRTAPGRLAMRQDGESFR